MGWQRLLEVFASCRRISHLDLLERLLEDLVSAPMVLSIVSRSIEHPGQRRLWSDPQGAVVLGP